ncbi:hypothetical protein [Denitrobaculum tricleocarpae]|uniref:Uncharacterized protein n=1 Tax=Denitrobaculum tricleocarpae TaxID=2591009 RepID=A0A545TMQ9_9PROT|nr:hypothetical protein [Denitrobaculum tricleocarpae]TQV78458.1 hypothetical protein FKG95_18015 [Denitrobaculum tricleocarpae]
MMNNQPKLMGRSNARRVENSIIGLGIAALIMIFQPFSLTLFSIGCVLVVIAGLSNNLLPVCKPEGTWRGFFRVALIILTVFVVVVAIAIGSAVLYGVYLRAQ